VWLFVNGADLTAKTLDKQYVIFTKGSPKTQAGPTLLVGYESTQKGTVKPATKDTLLADTTGANVAVLSVWMDLYDGNTQILQVRNVPIAKWFHVAVRLENTAMDIYVNGNVAEHFVLPAVPKQNYGDVHVFPSGSELGASGSPDDPVASDSFTGYLSDLVYYPYALNVYRLNAIVAAGPNKSMAAANSLSTALSKGGSNDYLAGKWYSDAMNHSDAASSAATP